MLLLPVEFQQLLRIYAIHTNIAKQSSAIATVCDHHTQKKGKL